MTKTSRIVRRAIHREYKRELSQYWKLDFVTRLKLAWKIAIGRPGG